MAKTSKLVFEDLRTNRVVSGNVEPGSNTYYTKSEAILALMVGKDLQDETILQIARDLVIHYHEVIHDREYYALSMNERDGRFGPFISGRVPEEMYFKLVNSVIPQKQKPEKKKH
jgi:hypothetical protein